MGAAAAKKLLLRRPVISGPVWQNKAEVSKMKKVRITVMREEAGG